MAAKRGRSVLIKVPSYCAKKPSPNAFAKDPSAGKHDAQPIAAVSVPKDPVLSDKRVIIVKNELVTILPRILKYEAIAYTLSPLIA